MARTMTMFAVGGTRLLDADVCGEPYWKAEVYWRREGRRTPGMRAVQGEVSATQAVRALNALSGRV